MSKLSFTITKIDLANVLRRFVGTGRVASSNKSTKQLGASYQFKNRSRRKLGKGNRS